MNDNDHVLIQVGKVVSYSAAGTTLISGLSLSEWGVVIGTVFWVLTWVANQYWSRRREKREEEEMRQRMEYRRRLFEERGMLEGEDEST